MCWSYVRAKGLPQLNEWMRLVSSCSAPNLLYSIRTRQPIRDSTLQGCMCVYLCVCVCRLCVYFANLLDRNTPLTHQAHLLYKTTATTTTMELETSWKLLHRSYESLQGPGHSHRHHARTQHTRAHSRCSPWNWTWTLFSQRHVWFCVSCAPDSRAAGQQSGKIVLI